MIRMLQKWQINGPSKIYFMFIWSISIGQYSVVMVSLAQSLMFLDIIIILVNIFIEKVIGMWYHVVILSVDCQQYVLCS